MRIPCLLSMALFLMTVATATAQEKALSYYTIGNSLTQDTVPAKLDGDVQWHVDCGKSLPYIYENPGKPCVANSTLWPDAFNPVRLRLGNSGVPLHGNSTAQPLEPCGRSNCF